MKRTPQPLSPLNHLGPVRAAVRIRTSPGEEESLISVIARTAVSHFLSITDFMREVVATLVPEEERIGILDWDNLAYVVGPNVHANRAIRIFDEVTGLGDHAQFTFKAFENLWTHQSLRLRRCRAWCPECYLEDVQAGRPVYDRLVWTVAAVAVCPVHHMKLHSKCLNCGKEKERFHLAGYQPGICGSCGQWLRPLTSTGLQYADRRSLDAWCSSAVFEMLSHRATGQVLARSHVRDWLRRIADGLFDGNQNAMARHLRISKAHLSQCINGKETPAAEKLLQISYISQVPLVDLYGSVSLSVDFMRLTPLPTAVKRRARRVTLTPEVRARVEHVVSRLEANGLTGLTTWSDVARFAKVNLDAVYSVAGPRVSKISALMRGRRSERRRWREEATTKLIYDAINDAFTFFSRTGMNVARRPIMAHVALTGAPVDFRKHDWIYGLVLKERGKPDKHKTSELSSLKPSLPGDGPMT